MITPQTPKNVHNLIPIPETILGIFRVVYPNGVEEVKNLVRYEDYRKIILTFEREITELKEDTTTDHSERIMFIRRLLIQKFGTQWFHTNSPLYKALLSPTKLFNCPGNIFHNHHLIFHRLDYEDKRVITEKFCNFHGDVYNIDSTNGKNTKGSLIKK